MPNLFGLDIAGIVNDSIAAAGGVLDAVLIKVTSGTRTVGVLTGGLNPTEASYACKGFIDNYAARQYDNELILQGDRKITLLGASIAGAQVPSIADKVTIEGTTWNIVGVVRDPAAATYECQARL